MTKLILILLIIFILLTVLRSIIRKLNPSSNKINPGAKVNKDKNQKGKDDIVDAKFEEIK